MLKKIFAVLLPLIAPVALSGCASWAGGFGFGVSTAPATPFPRGAGHYASLSASSDNRVLSGIILAVMFAEGVRYYLRQEDGGMVALDWVPEPDPARRINVQDCSATVILNGGNLKCR